MPIAPPAIPLRLEEALAAAATANIDLLHARQARAAAAAARIIAAARPNPVFTFQDTQLRPRYLGLTPIGPVADTQFHLDTTLEMGGKRHWRMVAAAAGLAAADADLANAARGIGAQIAYAYIDVHSAQDRLAATQRIADDWARGLDLARRRLALGDISAGEVARQQVEATKAGGDLLVEQAALREAQTILAILIGRDADAAALVASDPWPALPQAIATDDIDSLADRRPDVAAARARLAQARGALSGARALRVPDINVGVQFEHQNQPVGIGNSVGFGVGIPLQIGTRYSGEITTAGIAVADAQATAEKALSIATAEIAAARSALATAGARRQRIANELLPAARTAASTAEFAYARGALALTDLLDARRALAAAALSLVDAEAGQAAAITHLQQAQATGDQP